MGEKNMSETKFAREGYRVGVHNVTAATSS